MSSTDRSEIAARLSLVVGRMNRRIRTAPDGLSHGLVSALATIVRTGPIRAGDLARAEVVAAPTMTRILADLEGRGLIVRTADPVDGRSFFVESTEAGVKAIENARAERAEMVLTLLADLSDEELLRIEGALDPLEASVG